MFLLIGVIENMSWFTPADMPEKKYLIFGEGGGKQLAKKSKSVLLGQLPLVSDIRESSDNGMPIVLQEGHPAQGNYIKLAEETIKQVNIRNDVLAPTQVVGVNVQS